MGQLIVRARLEAVKARIGRFAHPGVMNFTLCEGISAAPVVPGLVSGVRG
ncbi:hypothetical protein [Saccharopolyspora karakumensis]|nr:hypothetical protein [Saccharopolyspora karakumensis]